MYSRPSASQMRLPSPRSMKGGTPPTARKARTGEFTPPGMILRERSNNRSFFEAMCSEHRCKLPRAVLDVFGIEQGADHCDRIDTCIDQGLSVVTRDPSDRHDGAAKTRLGIAIQRERRAHRAGLGRGSKRAAERDVVCAGVTSGHGELEIVVAGGAQDLGRSEALARRSDRPVLAPEVQPVGPDRFGELEIVVDDERNARCTAQCEQRPALLAPQKGIRGFAAVLDDARPAGEGERYLSCELRGAALVGGDRVKAP